MTTFFVECILIYLFKNILLFMLNEFAVLTSSENTSQCIVERCICKTRDCTNKNISQMIICRCERTDHLHKTDTVESFSFKVLTKLIANLDIDSIWVPISASSTLNPSYRMLQILNSFCTVWFILILFSASCKDKRTIIIK